MSSTTRRAIRASGRRRAGARALDRSRRSQAPRRGGGVDRQRSGQSAGEIRAASPPAPRCSRRSRCPTGAAGRRHASAGRSSSRSRKVPAGHARPCQCSVRVELSRQFDDTIVGERACLGSVAASSVPWRCSPSPFAAARPGRSHTRASASPSWWPSPRAASPTPWRGSSPRASSSASDRASWSRIVPAPAAMSRPAWCRAPRRTVTPSWSPPPRWRSTSRCSSAINSPSTISRRSPSPPPARKRWWSIPATRRKISPTS